MRGPSVRGHRRRWAERAGLPHDGAVIEVRENHFEMFPREFHHAPQGSGSGDHPNWCADFVPWEPERNIQDERVRLGCTL